MIHLYDLYPHGGPVGAYADARGYVPEAGDSCSLFTWEFDVVWTEIDWIDFVADAITRTEEAKRRLAQAVVP